MTAAYLQIVVLALAATLILLARSIPILARSLAVASAAAAAVATVFVPANAGWFAVLGPVGLPSGELELPLLLGLRPWGPAVAGVVTAVVLAIQAYSVWYLRDDDRYAAFAATVALFSSAMLLVVHSDDVVLTIIGWEVMGWCSYLLIGHWSRRESARRAAHKAFLVTRVADIGFVLGMILLAAQAGTTRISAITMGDRPPSPTLTTVALCLIITGILGKSAQFPFQDWLPDAMEGPTPASALIHAATMVAAGTVVLTQVSGLLMHSGVARWYLAVVTAITMVGAAVLAFGQSDLKRLLAWSTVSQVAIMLTALTAAPSGAEAGLFYLWSHAVFKSLLFLAIGWLGVVGGGTAARLLRGTGRRVPVAGALFLVGLLSLAGVPLLVGGLSKEHVITAMYAAASQGQGQALLALVAVLATVPLTAAYATRAFLVLIARTDEPSQPAAQAPVWVQATLGVLALGSILGGLVLITSAFALHGQSITWSLVTLLLVLAGSGIAVLLGRRDEDPAERLLRGRVRAFDTGLGADTAYRALVARPVLGLARMVALFDREVLDGYVVATGATARGAGWLTERAHRRERPSFGLALVTLGLIALALVGVIAWR